MSEIDLCIKRIKSHKGVKMVLIVNDKGQAIQSTMVSFLAFVFFCPREYVNILTLFIFNRTIKT